MAEIAIFQPGQRAVALNAFDEAVEPGLEFCIGVAAQYPGHRQVLGEVQRRAQVRYVLVGQVFDAFIEGDIFDTPVAKLFEQFEDIGSVEFDDLEVPNPLRECTQRFRLARTGHDMNRFATQLLEFVQRQGGFVLDQDVAGQEDRRRRFDRRIAARRQPAGRQVVAGAGDLGFKVVRIGNDIFDPDAQFLGKNLGQVIFQSAGIAVLIGCVGQRAGTDEDDEVVLGWCGEGQATEHLAAAGDKKNESQQ